MGSFQFNRVVMNVLNVSIYTQKMSTRMFSNTRLKDSRPLIDNELMIQTDDGLINNTDLEEIVLTTMQIKTSDPVIKIEPLPSGWIAANVCCLRVCLLYARSNYHVSFTLRTQVLTTHYSLPHRQRLRKLRIRLPPVLNNYLKMLPRPKRKRLSPPQTNVVKDKHRQP